MQQPIFRAGDDDAILQHQTPETRKRVIESLWRRGAPGDVEAIEAIVATSADDPPPAFLVGPAGTKLSVALGKNDARDATFLVAELYWNDDVSAAEIEAAHRGSSAWAGARTGSGELVGTARALSDGVKHAWIYDVAVAPDFHRRGIGDAVVRLLLDHPALRRVRKIHLGTRDAMAFYERMGFVRKASIQRPYASEEMVLLRPSSR